MKKTIIATIAALTIAPSIALAKDPSQTPSNVQFGGPVTVEKLDTLLKDSNMFSLSLSTTSPTSKGLQNRI